MVYNYKKHIIATVGFICLFLVSVIAQERKNPFELSGRPTLSQDTSLLDNNETETTSNPFEINSPEVVTPPVSTEAPKSTNPFELESDTATKAINSEDFPASASPENPFELPAYEKASKTNITKPTHTVKGNQPTKTVVSPSLSSTFRLWLLIGLLTIVTILVTLYKDVLSKVYRSFLNDNFLRMVHRDQGTIVSIPYLLLYVFSLICIGIFVFVLLKFYEINFFENNFFNMLVCIGGVMAIFGLKHLVLRIIGFVFPIEKEITQYSFTIIIFGIVLGFSLIIASILIAYAPAHLSQTLIYGSFILVGAIYLYRILRSLLIVGRYISLHTFHFFVYLCTIEIAPLLILLKLSGGL